MKEGWEYKTIKECCTELFAGGDVPKPDVSKNKTQNFTVPIYTNGVENEGLYGYTNNARVYEPAVTISARGTIGATFRRYTPFYPAIRLITAVPNKDLLCIDYLYYALKILTVGNSGTSIPQLTIPNIKNIVIPVPPLSEQQRIVDYLDAAFAKIDAMKANAEKAINEGKALFQASLKEMLEPQEGWEEKKLGDICDFRSGFAFKSNKFTKIGEPIIRISDIQNEEIDDSNLVYFDSKSYTEDLSKYLIYPDDILIAMSGGTTGKLGINTSNRTFYLNQRVGVFRENKSYLNHRYLYHYLHTKSEESLRIAAGAAQPNLSTAQIKSFIIPVPPLSEQQSIVDSLDSLKSKVDKLQKNFDKISQECDALKQAILRQVFE